MQKIAAPEMKIACALAAQGRSLQDISAASRLAAANTVSIGVGLAHVHVPGRSDTSRNPAQVSKGNAELRMGIHNETGSSFEKADVAELVEKMLEQLLDIDDSDRAFLQVNDPIVLMVNNLGGIIVLELGAITAVVGRQLASDYNIHPVRVLSGTYMTSLNGMGFSITLVNLEANSCFDLLELLDAPAQAVGWSAPISPEAWRVAEATVPNNHRSGEGEPRMRMVTQIENGVDVGSYDAILATDALVRGLRRLIEAEPEITHYDTIVGDGYCGIGLKRGAEGELKYIDMSSCADYFLAVLRHVLGQPLVGSAVLDLASILPIIETSMDGTSGALYTIFLNSLLHAFQTRGSGVATPETWALVLKHCSSILARCTPARVGDRTVIDALDPFIQEFGKIKSLARVAQAARYGAESTIGMQASLGRSVYVGGSGFEQVPDPGAWGLSEFLTGLAGLDES
ncbi:unnamed protein product [Fusarium graminearum]|nr:unnamed protein product [Fusarium graminearum]